MAGRKTTSFNKENDDFLLEKYLQLQTDSSLSKKNIYREFRTTFNTTIADSTINKRGVDLYEEYLKNRGITFVKINLYIYLIYI
jgi:hypothetical protein